MTHASDFAEGFLSEVWSLAESKAHYVMQMMLSLSKVQLVDEYAFKAVVNFAWTLKIVQEEWWAQIVRQWFKIDQKNIQRLLLKPWVFNASLSS